MTADGRRRVKGRDDVEEAATLPEPLKLLWSYDAGDVIESSAAIVDGTVYVGAGVGDLLAIDLARVAAPTVIEDPDGHFPHIYGPLNLDAVTGVRRVTRDDSGRFLGVGSAL